MNESENTAYQNLWDTKVVYPLYPCYTKEIYSLKYLHLQKKEYLKSLNKTSTLSYKRKNKKNKLNPKQSEGWK